MLDEVDKIGSDFRGDPSAALLEVLDPEQNNTFRDNYLGMPYDLSDVMFITTANLLDPIQPAFRDRMEVIRLAGYTAEEKLAIARKHLVPRQVEQNGLSPAMIEFSDNTLAAMISGYTQGGRPQGAGARPGPGLPQGRPAGGGRQEVQCKDHHLQSGKLPGAGSDYQERHPGRGPGRGRHRSGLDRVRR